MKKTKLFIQAQRVILYIARELEVLGYVLGQQEIIVVLPKKYQKEELIL